MEILGSRWWAPSGVQPWPQRGEKTEGLAAPSVDRRTPVRRRRSRFLGGLTTAVAAALLGIAVGGANLAEAQAVQSTVSVRGVGGELTDSMQTLEQALYRRGLELLRDDSLDFNARYEKLGALSPHMYTWNVLHAPFPEAALRYELMRTVALDQALLILDDDSLDRAERETALRDLGLPLDVRAILDAPSPAAELERQYGPLQQQSFAHRVGLDRLDLPKVFERFPIWVSIGEIAKNRLEPRAADDHRPTAVYLFPKSDWNGAFEREQLLALTRGYRVLYYEVGSDREMRDALRDARKLDGTAELLVIGGHGTQTSVQFGEGAFDEAHFDLTDRRFLQSDLRKAVAPGGHVVLKSCSTGMGRGAVENIANEVSDMIPHAHVWAPTKPTNNSLRLDDDGRFVGPGYQVGDADVYHVTPRR